MTIYPPPPPGWGRAHPAYASGESSIHVHWRVTHPPPALYLLDPIKSKYTWLEGGTVRGKCLAQEHNAVNLSIKLDCLIQSIGTSILPLCLHLIQKSIRK